MNNPPEVMFELLCVTTKIRMNITSPSKQNIPKHIPCILQKVKTFRISQSFFFGVFSHSNNECCRIYFLIYFTISVFKFCHHFILLYFLSLTIWVFKFCHNLSFHHKLFLINLFSHFFHLTFFRFQFYSSRVLITFF